MKMVINNQRKIFDIQEEFNSLFPYLKLEFYFSPPTFCGYLSPQTISNSGKTLGECITMPNEQSMIIFPKMSVANLEKSFKQLFGIPVIIFRKSGKGWLKTSFTDYWSLEEQNVQGESLSKKAS
jgi:hypothetical protein